MVLLYTDGRKIVTALDTLIISVEANGETVSFGAGATVKVTFTYTVPVGYKALGYSGLLTSGASGAVNWYSYIGTNIYNKTGTFTADIYFKNYTNTALSDILLIPSILCKRYA